MTTNCECPCHTNSKAEHIVKTRVYENYGDVVFDVKDPRTWPAMVIATSIDAGREFAEMLGIRNYIVCDSVEQTRGRRMRSVVATPGYLYEIERKAWGIRDAYDAAMQGFAHLPKEHRHRG